MAQSIAISAQWATKGAATRPFGAIMGMAESPNGSVWVSDQPNSEIWVLSSDGMDPSILARSGDGPGEVSAPDRIAVCPEGSTMAVYDLGRPAIELFAPDGGFKRRITLDRLVYNPKGFACLGDDRFVLSGGVSRMAYSIHVFGGTGGWLRGMEPLPLTRNPQAATLIAGGPIWRTSSGSLLYSQAAPHRILHYDLSDESYEELAADPDLIPAIGDDFIHDEGSGQNLVRTFRWFFPQSRGVFQLEDGRVLNIVWRFHDEQSVWQLYSPAGELIAQNTVGCAYEPWSLSRAGQVLASFRDPNTGEHVAVKLGFEVTSGPPNASPSGCPG